MRSRVQKLFERGETPSHIKATNVGSLVSTLNANFNHSAYEVSLYVCSPIATEQEHAVAYLYGMPVYEILVADNHPHIGQVGYATADGCFSTGLMLGKVTSTRDLSGVDLEQEIPAAQVAPLAPEFESPNLPELMNKLPRESVLFIPCMDALRSRGFEASEPVCVLMGRPVWLITAPHLVADDFYVYHNGQVMNTGFNRLQLAKPENVKMMLHGITHGYSKHLRQDSDNIPKSPLTPDGIIPLASLFVITDEQGNLASAKDSEQPKRGQFKNYKIVDDPGFLVTDENGTRAATQEEFETWCQKQELLKTMPEGATGDESNYLDWLRTQRQAGKSLSLLEGMAFDFITTRLAEVEEISETEHRTCLFEAGWAFEEKTAGYTVPSKQLCRDASNFFLDAMARKGVAAFAITSSQAFNAGIVAMREVADQLDLAGDKLVVESRAERCYQIWIDSPLANPGQGTMAQRAFFAGVLSAGDTTMAQLQSHDLERIQGQFAVFMLRDLEAETAVEMEDKMHRAFMAGFAYGCQEATDSVSVWDGSRGKSESDRAASDAKLINEGKSFINATNQQMSLWALTKAQNALRNANGTLTKDQQLELLDAVVEIMEAGNIGWRAQQDEHRPLPRELLQESEDLYLDSNQTPCGFKSTYRSVTYLPDVLGGQTKEGRRD